VFAHAVENAGVVARVAKRLGLPHLDPDVADGATNKARRIAILAAAGIAVAPFAEVRSLAEAGNAATRIGYPVVVKPLDNAGARGVKKIAREKKLAQGFREAVSHGRKNKNVLIEKFLEGYEISTESVVIGGTIVTTGFADRNYTRAREFAPYFIEDGHNVPSTISTRMRRKIERVVERAIRALGINQGVAKGDILVQGTDVYVIEMAARTSGGWFAAGTVPLATGINILKPLIKIAVGEIVTLKDVQAKRHRAACQRYIIPSQEGLFDHLEGVSAARRMPGVKVLQVFHLPKRHEMIHKARSNADRFGHLIAVGDTVTQATRRCEKAMQKIRVVLADKTQMH
jgi:biotin carboxylase